MTSPSKTPWTIDHRILPIDLLDEDPDNANEHGEENLAGIGASLGEYGLQKPIVVIATGDRFRVIAGNGTLRQAREAGATELSVAVSDLDGLRAMGYAIADNQTSRTSHWNFARLQPQLQRLAAANFHMPATGFGQGDLGNLLNARFEPPPREPLDSFAPAPTEPAPADAPPESTQPAEHFDSWCTSPKDIELVLAVTRLEGFDLDVASNEHSIVPARVALFGGPDGADTKALAACKGGDFKPGGREHLQACGLKTKWPTTARVWSNPPYSDPTPWVFKALLHAAMGGRGVLLVPASPEVAWGQSILLARTDLKEALRLLAPHAKPKAPEAVEALEKLRVKAAPWRPLVPRGRLSFVDPWRGGEPVSGNRLGSFLAFYGFPTLNDSAVATDAGVWL